MPKLPKSDVGFEHPAQGPNHCSQCRHFQSPHGCALIRGHINRGDWCRKFASRAGLRQVKTDAHLNAIGGKT